MTFFYSYLETFMSTTHLVADEDIKDPLIYREKKTRRRDYKRNALMFTGKSNRGKSLIADCLTSAMMATSIIQTNSKFLLAPLLSGVNCVKIHELSRDLGRCLKSRDKLSWYN